jgi:hypothetical protein
MSSDLLSTLANRSTNTRIQFTSMLRETVVVIVVLALASDEVLVVSNLAVLEVVAVVVVALLNKTTMRH